MSNDLMKTAKRASSATPTQDAASRLKHDLMADALGRMFGKAEKPIAPGTPRVLLALANHGRNPGWERAKTLQRQMFEAAAGSGLEMKFACYGQDNAEGVRRFRITTRWINDPDDMATIMGRAECNCGCYVHIASVLEQAVKENNQDRPMRAVIIVGDAFHDNEDSLTEAALAANQLRREGTRVFLIQQGEDPATARKLQHLQRVSGASYFKFDQTQQQQFAEMLEMVSAYAAGGEEAVKAVGGRVSNLLLEHLKQQSMPIFDEERDRVRVDRR
jgi:hypothetical protein